MKKIFLKDFKHQCTNSLQEKSNETVKEEQDRTVTTESTDSYHVLQLPTEATDMAQEQQLPAQPFQQEKDSTLIIIPGGS